jgi:hypothetical protein
MELKKMFERIGGGFLIWCKLGADPLCSMIGGLRRIGFKVKSFLSHSK